MHAWIGACERHSKSTEDSRRIAAAETYAASLTVVCGVDGMGAGLGTVPFPTKERVPSAGGPWTFEKSALLRPKKKGLLSAAVMTKGKEVVRKVVNVYQALEKKFLVNDKLPSGWNDDDLNDAILYNLYMSYKARMEAEVKVKKEPKEEGEAEKESGGVDGQHVGGAGTEGSPIDMEVPGQRPPELNDQDDDIEEVDPALDLDVDVFSQELLTIKSDFQVNAAEMARYEAKEQVSFCAFKMFGSRSPSIKALPWLKSMPPEKEKPDGGVSNASRAAQKDESRSRRGMKPERHEDDMKPSSGSAKPQAQLPESLDITALAVRMHGTACMQYKLQVDAAKDLFSFAQPGEEADAAKAAVMVILKAGAPTLNDMLEQLRCKQQEQQ